MVGINRLATALSLTYSSNRVSVGNINETMTSLVAHNRGLYRLLIHVTRYDPSLFTQT